MLGAERAFEAAELDLRNEAEDDHERETEPDRAAPAEHTISLPHPPAGTAAGAEVSREEPSSSDRAPRRPRPPVRALIVGAMAAACVGFAVLRGGGEETDRPVIAEGAAIDPGHIDAWATDRPTRDRRPRAMSRPTERASAPGDRRRTEAKPARRSREAERPAASPEPSIAVSTPAPPAAPVVADPASAPPPPATPAPPAGETAPAESAAATEPTQPVQSAAAVRQEFGP
ncbi:MAG: hypothetical protein GEU88_20065 [Solirubrobacterales bacterium]|nr:hypothetical protein [Solirubrobacterales bacterium]